MLRTSNTRKTIFKLLFAALLVVLFAIFIGMATKTSAATWTDLTCKKGTTTVTNKYKYTDGGTYTVTVNQNVTVSEEIRVENGSTLIVQVTADASYTISRATEKTGTNYIFVCRPGCTINITGKSSSKHLIIDGKHDGSTAGAYSLMSVQGTVSLTNVTLQNNYVEYSSSLGKGRDSGGAIVVINYTNGDYAGTTSNQKLTMDYCTITNCHAKTYSGAISLENGSDTTTTGTNPSIKITNTEITGCSAKTNGGAIGVHSGSKHRVELGTGNNFHENKAVQGGAIYWAPSSSDAKLTISGGSYNKNTISSNTAEDAAGNNGEGIYYLGGAICINNGSSTSNTVEISNADISSNNATLGGGIYLNGKLKINSGTISKNTAYPLGGGIYVYAGTLTIAGGNIHSNDTGGEKTSGRKYSKWGSYYDDSDPNKNGIEIGGGIFMYDGKIVMTAGTIGADATGKSNSAYFGAGVYMNNGTFEASGGKISYNDGSYNSQTNINQGGGMFVNNGTVVLSGSFAITHNGNTDRTVAGGGIYLYQGTLTMDDDAKIDYNTAYNAGGGVYVYGTADTKNFIMSGGSISYNTMKGYHRGAGNVPFSNVWASYGGGVYVRDGDFEMKGGTISNNEAWLWGGGIEILNGNFYMSDGTISDNKLLSQGENHTVTVNGEEVTLKPVQAAGGGIFFANSATFEMTGGEISGNEVYGVGGGIWIRYNGKITINGGTICNNKAYNCTFDMQSSDGTDAGTYDKEGCGGGIYMSNGTVTFKSGTIYGNTAAQDGAGIYIYKGNFSMSGGTIGGTDGANVATQYGGGVYLHSGKVTISGTAKIDSNTANSYGGGVYLYDGTFIMENGAISNNTAKTKGGGVYINDASFEMSAGSISSNKCGLTAHTQAGYEGGGVYIYKGDFSMSGGSIASNSGVNNGGGVYVYAGDFTLSGSAIIENNSATREGGGIYVYGLLDGVKTGGNITMSGSSKIRNNSATGYYRTYETGKGWASYGGGVYLYNGTFTMSESAAISGNQAWLWGGGVEINQGDFIMLGGTISGNVIGPRAGESEIGATNVDSYSPSAQRGGGAIMIVVGTFRMDDGTISDHTIAGRGGAILLRDSGCNLIINGGTIENNTVTSRTDIDDTTSGYGGAIYVLASGASVTMSGGSIDSNTAAISGGGIYMDNGSFSMTGGTISNNVSNASSDHTGGGGIFIRNASATVTVSGANTQIYGNSAVMSGGGIFLHTGNFELTDAMIGGDTADKANSAKWGGGIYVHAGNFRMYSGSIKNNTSTNVGAGVCLWGDNVTFIMDSGLISENKATVENGGGVYVANGTFTMNDGTISKNTTVKNGGGVYVANGTFTMNDGLIQANASVHGGGVYVASGTFDMKKGDINSNDASGNGGGVYVAGNFTMSGGQIGGGTASAAQNGGGVYVLNGSFTLSGDGKIAENSASRNGGGVYFNSPDNNFTLNSSNAYIQNNSADNSGGGVFLEAGNFIMVNGNISSNQCADKGGAIYIEKGNFNMENGTISGNETTGSTGGGNGGALYVRRGNFTMSNGTISGNTAAKNGGAVYVWTHAEVDTDKTVITIQNSEITISGGTVTNNNANQGGAFYIHGGDLTVTGGSFTNNTAKTGGGAIYVFEDRYYISNNKTTPYITLVNIQSGTFTGNVTEAEQGGAITIWLVKGSKADVVIGIKDCKGGDDISKHASHPVFQNNVAKGASCGGIYISKDTLKYTPSAGDTFLQGIYTTNDLDTEFESSVTLSIYCGDITGNDGNLKEDVNLLIENGVVVLAGAANLGTEGIILSGGTLTLEHGFDVSDLTGIMVTGGTLQRKDPNGNILPNVTLTFVIDWDGDGIVDITETASVPSNFPLRLPSYDKNDLTTIAWYTDNVNDYEMVETTFELTASTTYIAIVNYWGHGIRLDPLAEAEKNYNNVDHTDDITVNNDSAFTVEFAIHYMEASKFGDRVLSFTTAPAAGTTILLIDKTYAADKNIVKYYYYTFTGGETEVDLTSFKQLGTGTAYKILEATYTNEEEDYVSETLTFIFDLADTTTTTGAFDITFTVKSADGNDAKDTVHSESITLAAKRTFTLSESDSTISYETTATGGSGDSRYSGKEYSIVVSAQNGTIPKDMFLTVGGNKYYLNKNGYFIIPLGNATSADVLMAAKSLSANGLGLELTATLWASENGSAPFMGEAVASVGITFAQTPLPTFTINEETSDRTVTADGTLTVNFEKTNVTGNVTVKIQKKVDGNYADVAGAAVTVNDTSFTVTANTLDLGASGYETYRAVITVNGIDVIYYNFIVIID